MKPLSMIVLAAGNSTRLKSRLTKVMHPLCGRPLLDYVLATARALRPKRIAVVLGNDRERVLEHLKGQKGLIFAHQKERRGTAHAAQVGLKALGQAQGHVVILSGDVPLLKPETLKRLLRLGAARPLSLVTAVVADPFGYGRILRDGAGRVQGIVEEKNASPEERQINEINAGIYCVEAGFLRKALAQIRPDPVKKEFYLTDIVGYAASHGIPVHTVAVEQSHEILGVNTRAELAYLEQIHRQEIAARHLDAGIGMQDPNTVYIDADVKVGEDSYLGAGVQLLGATKVGKGCRIGPGCIVIDSQLGDGVQLRPYSHLDRSVVKSGATVGPFSHLRPASVVSEEAHVGNFVELKKTVLGRGSKANHLSYLGDAVIGRGVNIGAGTITCNYDGKKKFPTYLEDEVFVGSDTQLVAPVRVGKGAYIGAGTTVTQNVPPGALAVSRVPQRNIKGYKGKK
ncbi:MAG: bifunctional UDP-N-acetylglucosamine diphosphorylase/glucosamine-1-phosphate N-acetyltransferase GlmU [bacterium]